MNFKPDIRFILRVSLVLAVACAVPAGAGGGREESNPGAGPTQARLPVQAGWQEWADADRSGTLDAGELQVLLEALAVLCNGPHPVGNPLDERFDRNRDGRIGPDETEAARMVFFGARLRRLFEASPEAAARLDYNGNRRIDDEELQYLRDFLFLDPRLREPRRVTTSQEQKMDLNGDRRLDAGELLQVRRQLFRLVALLSGPLPEPGVPEGELPPVLTYLDEAADLDGDGRLNPEERRFMELGLRGEHPVGNPFDRRIDSNHNGKVEPFEIARARRTAEKKVAREGQEGAYPIHTGIDELFDLDGSGTVTTAELEEAARLLAAAPRPAAQTRLDRLLDADRNGRIGEEEVVRARERFLLPHPTDRDLDSDRRLDRNQDGFVEPEEIGLAAGFSPAGPVPPLDELLERLRWREPQGGGEVAGRPDEGTREKEQEKPVQRKIGRLEGKGLAVVGLDATTQNVDDDTKDGVLVFMENAFVNAGSLKVVDRRNIEKILQEHEFQQSDLSDEATAVQIGKLSGADVIAIGSISLVGGRYYLNVKLISVSNGEILGSSIAEAAEQSQFYDMCNEAVSRLF